MSNEQIVELDVRPTLEAGGEPFQEIMDTVKALREEDIFILHATFNPVPLLKVMENKGYQNEPLQIEQGHWEIRFWKEPAK